jgi:hypothetical protein
VRRYCGREKKDVPRGTTLAIASTPAALLRPFEAHPHSRVSSPKYGDVELADALGDGNDVNRDDPARD